MLTTNPFDDDKLREECGIFGIWGAEHASNFVALGLHALQHRGQEAAGITSFDGGQFHSHRAMGHVAGSFDREETMRKLAGRSAIGHVRYSTTGETALRNVQPLFAELSEGGFAVAHNGNLSNALKLRRTLNRRGSIFQSTSDTEVIIHLVATSDKANKLDQLVDALKQVEGAYSLVVLTDDGLVACRPFEAVAPRPCIFEHVYFSRPDSIAEGVSVYEVRKNIGAELSRESPVEADYVVPVPDSGVPAALGFSQASGIPFELGIIRSHYVGRTFIQPNQAVRLQGVKLKHNANSALIDGKSIVLVDDSIVRGTTSVKLVQMMRDAGAREVHMRIASPPTRHSCFYGVDTPERAKLLAAQMTVEQMRDYINADSLAFISIEGLYRALGQERDGKAPQRCDACFTGDYPTSLTDVSEKDGGSTLSLVASR
jgi:amidophosphoribosyltransferase